MNKLIRKPVDQEQLANNKAVETFATLMIQKLNLKREEGRHGWRECKPEDLARMFWNHLPKCDMIDVANFAMFLHYTQGEQALSIEFHKQTTERLIKQDNLAHENHKLRGMIEKLAMCLDNPNTEKTNYVKELVADAKEAIDNGIQTNLDQERKDNQEVFQHALRIINNFIDNVGPCKDCTEDCYDTVGNECPFYKELQLRAGVKDD